MIALDAKYALLLPHQTVCNERLYEKKIFFEINKFDAIASICITITYGIFFGL